MVKGSQGKILRERLMRKTKGKVSVGENKGKVHKREITLKLLREK